MNLHEMVVLFESAARSGEEAHLTTPFLMELAESLMEVEKELQALRHDLLVVRRLLAQPEEGKPDELRRA